jgi:hypothetical protein
MIDPPAADSPAGVCPSPADWAPNRYAYAKVSDALPVQNGRQRSAGMRHAKCIAAISELNAKIDSAQRTGSAAICHVGKGTKYGNDEAKFTNGHRRHSAADGTDPA